MNNCVLSWDITVMDHDAHMIYQNGQPVNSPKEIRFGNHCWIGFNSRILKGAIIPQNAIIAANTTVTKDLMIENAIFAGTPAKPIKENVIW